MPSKDWQARAIAAMLLVFGAATLAPNLFASYREGSRVIRLVVGGVAFLVAAVMMIGRRRVERVSQHLAMLVGVAVVTVSVWNEGADSALFGEAILYGWVLSLAFALFPMRAAFGYLGVVGAALAGVLATNWRPEDLSAWFVIMMALGGPAVLIGYLVSYIRQLALQDPLTGVYNRRAFSELLTREMSSCSRRGEHLALVAMDLDDLKVVNDTLGHAEGDRLLRGAATSWRGALRKEDLLARLGGDEFGVILPGCQSEQAVEVVDRLSRADGSVSVSIGCVTWRGETAAELLDRADAAMYLAKSEGTNVVVFADGSGPRLPRPRRPSSASRGSSLPARSGRRGTRAGRGPDGSPPDRPT